jgi:hypothetical protein
MKQGKGSLGLGKRLKHSFTPFPLILFLISFISLISVKRVLRGFLLVLEEIEGRLKSLEGILKPPIGTLESLEEILNFEGYHL